MKKWYFVAFALPLMVQPGTAAESKKDATIMDEVVVSASRIEESKREVTANITTISREEIERSPSTNLADLLGEKGIGQIRKYPGVLSPIGLRGFRTDSHGNDLQGKVLILLDGRRAGTGNAHKLVTKNIERIEIIRGPGAVQYGSAGLGGVVNVITRRGKDNSLFVEAGVGSFERVDTALGGTTKTERFDFSGAVTYQKIDDYDIGDGDTYFNTAIDRELSASLNAGYTFAKNQRLGLIITAYDANDAGSPSYFSQIDLDDSSDKSNYSADLQYTGKSSEGDMQWMARFFLGEDEDKWFDPVASNPDGWDDGVPSFKNTDQLGAQVQGSIDLGILSLTSGFDWIDYEVKGTYSPQISTYSNPALFVLGKARFLDESLIATFGARYDWFEVEVKEPAGREEDQDNFTPQVGLAYLPLDNLKFRLQYAEGFMVPSADQLAIDFVGLFGRTVGNPDLDPESSKTYEGGVDFYLNSFNISLTYFHTDFEDKIVTTTLPGGDSSWENLGDATIEGFEIETSYDIGEPLDFNWEIRPYLQATFLTTFEDEETGEDLLYTSDTTLSTGISLNNFKGFTSQFNVAYYSSQDVQDWESGLFPAPVVELDDFTVAYLSLAYKFYESEEYGAFTVSGDVNNIFDEEYAYVKGFPMPGRSLYVNLRWDF